MDNNNNAMQRKLARETKKSHFDNRQKLLCNKGITSIEKDEQAIEKDKAYQMSSQKDILEHFNQSAWLRICQSPSKTLKANEAKFLFAKNVLNFIIQEMSKRKYQFERIKQLKEESAMGCIMYGLNSNLNLLYENKTEGRAYLSNPAFLQML